MSVEQDSTRKENMNNDNDQKNDTDEQRIDAAAPEPEMKLAWGDGAWGDPGLFEPAEESEK